LNELWVEASPSQRGRQAQQRGGNEKAGIDVYDAVMNRYHATGTHNPAWNATIMSSRTFILEIEDLSALTVSRVYTETVGSYLAWTIAS